MTVMLGRMMYDPSNEDNLTVEDHLQLPSFPMSVNLPYQKFKVRQDATDVVERAERAIKAHSEGFKVVDESGASVLLAVLSHANTGTWLDADTAPYTGMYSLMPDGAIEGRHEAPAGYDGDSEDVEGTKCLPVIERDSFENPTDSVNTQLDKLFVGSNRYIRFEPTVGKDWTLVRQNQPLWRPLHTPVKVWTPAEMVAHPRYADLCLLAALATTEIRGKLAYAALDLVVGSAAWVDLDSAPKVQLVRHVAGLCHYSNGIRCNLARLDIEAHLRSHRASASVGKSK